jgi:glycosyltransferase involved in cell wall biosynthesis
MRILFVTNHKYLPDRVGGSESSTHELCTELMKRNHEVAVMSSIVTNLTLREWLDWQNLKCMIWRQRFSKDYIVGYPVFRGVVPAYRGRILGTGSSEIKRRFRPDIVVVQAGKPVTHAASWEAVSVPVVMYLHDVNFSILGGDPRSLKNTRFISNSIFTANKYYKEYGIPSDVVLNIVEPAKYLTHREGKNVTFINPWKLKGAEMAFQIAERLPHIPFLFVEGWPLNNEYFHEIIARINATRNIKWVKSTMDMKSVYKDTHILLVPSQCEEAWGRVVAEAQINGIPVLASNHGGLPESVGKGGVLIDANDIDKWILELTRLWNDNSYYNKISKEALIHAGREEIETSKVLDKFIQILLNAN